jgi:hypothetical protein
MITIEELLQFVAEETVSKNVNQNSDIERDLGCTGDDFSDFIDNYSKRFNVNVNLYLWYFHHTEEGNSWGSNFFNAPNEIVDHIPVTPNMLFEFAKKSKWDLKYPEHKLPKSRYDLIANQIFFGLIIILMAYFILRKYF